LPYFFQDFKAHILPVSISFENSSQHWHSLMQTGRHRINNFLPELAVKVAGELRAGFWWGKLKGPYGRNRHRWANNIKMDIQEIGRDTCSGWIWLLIEKSDGLL